MVYVSTYVLLLQVNSVGMYAAICVCVYVYAPICPMLRCWFEPQNRKECKYFPTLTGSQPPSGMDKSLLVFSFIFPSAYTLACFQ